MQDVPKTLFVGRGASGIAWYRIVLPAMALGQDWLGVMGTPPDLSFTSGLLDGELGLERFFDYEVVVLQQMRGIEWVKVIRRLQAAGVRVLFEIDDYIQAVRKIDSHEMRNFADAEYVRGMELSMRVTDGIICSTPFIAQRYRAFNRRTWVCPNGIDLKRYALRKPAREGVTIGWAGGVGHKLSIGHWLPAVREVLRARPETRFVTVGHPFANELRDEFGPERVRSLPFAALEVYPASMTLFDLALAPSGHNNLFRGKSDLRWLEASALGIPLIADPEVYPDVEDEVTGLRAVTPAEARDAMLRLVDEPALRERIGAGAHARVRQHRRIEVAAQRWAEVLREVAGREAAAA